MGKKPDYLVMFYFLNYCKSRKNGWTGLMDAMLNVLHDHGFDVKEIQGKWCLVEYDKGD